jgi:hypothetical protein
MRGPVRVQRRKVDALSDKYAIRVRDSICRSNLRHALVDILR